MDDLEKFRIRYAQPSDDAIITACTAYMAITGSVDTKAMEEAIKRAFSANSYKQSGFKVNSESTLKSGEWNASVHPTKTSDDKPFLDKSWLDETN